MKALEDDNGGSDSENSSSSGSGSSSDSSSFGKGGQGDDTKQKKKPKSKAKANAKGKAKSQAAPSNAVSKQKQKETEKAEAHIANTIATHQKTKDLLQELNPSAVWRSMVRTVELERRLSKASCATDELEALLNQEHAEPRREEISNLSKEISSLASVLGGVKAIAVMARQAEPQALSQEIQEGTEFLRHLASCSKTLFADRVTTADIVHVIAKKLAEAHWLILAGWSQVVARW